MREGDRRLVVGSERAGEGGQAAEVGNPVSVEVAGAGGDRLGARGGDEEELPGPIEGAEQLRELEPVDGRLSQDVAGVEKLRAEVVAARIRDPVVVEVAGPAGEDDVGEGADPAACTRGAHGRGGCSVQRDPVAERIDGDGGEPEFGEGAGEGEHVDCPARAEAVADDDGGEGRLVQRRLLRHRHEERDRPAHHPSRARVQIDLEARVLGRLVRHVEEGRRGVGA